MRILRTIPALAPRSVAPYLVGMKLTDAIKKFFRRRHADETAGQQPSATPQPLRIEGVKPAPLTPESDDAELAAQALLESMVSEELRVKSEEFATAQHDSTAQPNQPSSISHQPSKSPQPSVRDAAYYRRLAERIRLARDQATLRTMRFVTWCEQELEKRDLPIEGKGSLAQMEVELYKRIDTIERVGGELKQRWQHCLANVLVRRMEEEREAPAAETPSQTPNEHRPANPDGHRPANPNEHRPANPNGHRLQKTEKLTTLPVTEAAISTT